MVAVILSPDSTIRTVLPTLAHPEECVRIAVGHLVKCHKYNGNVSVYIRIMGKYIILCYKIIYFKDDGAECYFKAYDDDREFLGVFWVHESTWSTATMTLRETEELLRELPTAKG